MKKLSESVWGDLRKKSLGKEDRIEEDINNFDMQQLYDYLHVRYTFLDEFHHLSRIRSMDGIIIKVLESKKNYYGLDVYHIGEDNMEIRIDNVKLFTSPEYEKFGLNLLDNFILDENLFNKDNTPHHPAIYPKEGKVDNKFFIYLLDFFIENSGDKFKKIVLIDEKVK